MLLLKSTTQLNGMQIGSGDRGIFSWGISSDVEGSPRRVSGGGVLAELSEGNVWGIFQVANGECLGEYPTNMFGGHPGEMARFLSKPQSVTFGQYQIILLGDGATCEQLAPSCQSYKREQQGAEPTGSHSQAAGYNHYKPHQKYKHILLLQSSDVSI